MATCSARRKISAVTGPDLAAFLHAPSWTFSKTRGTPSTNVGRKLANLSVTVRSPQKPTVAPPSHAAYVTARARTCASRRTSTSSCRMRGLPSPPGAQVSRASASRLRCVGRSGSRRGSGGIDDRAGEVERQGGEGLGDDLVGQVGTAPPQVVDRSLVDGGTSTPSGGRPPASGDAGRRVRTGFAAPESATIHSICAGAAGDGSGTVTAPAPQIAQSGRTHSNLVPAMIATRSPAWMPGRWAPWRSP